MAVATSPVQLQQLNALLVAAGKQPGLSWAFDPTLASALNPCSIIAVDRTIADAQLQQIVNSAAAQYDPDYGAPNRKAAKAAVIANNTYIALASPSTAQNTAQIKALTQQMNAIIGIVARNLP